MWHNTYKDYPPDDPLIQNPVQSGKGIIGCEMHDLNGWGEKQHKSNIPPKTTLSTLCSWLLGTTVNTGK